MITANVLSRVFKIEVGDQLATAFTFDVDGRQYLTTARHVAGRVSGEAIIKIFHEGQWKKLAVRTVGHGCGHIDISVLAPTLRLSPPSPLEASEAGVTWGQDAYIIGFPYGQHGDIGPLNRDFPMPFVKRALVSCLDVSEQGPNILYLDSHSNPGFSGGPVIFAQPGRRTLKIAGVVSAQSTVLEHVESEDGPSPYVFLASTGITIAYGARHMRELVQANPIGFGTAV